MAPDYVTDKGENALMKASSVAKISACAHTHVRTDTSTYLSPEDCFFHRHRCDPLCPFCSQAAANGDVENCEFFIQEGWKAAQTFGWHHRWDEKANPELPCSLENKLPRIVLWSRK